MTTVAVDNLKLLIIEDDADQRELILETLEEHFGRGTVVGVGSRAEALQQPLASFHLILSDYNLPDSTGLELIEAIRSRCTAYVRRRSMTTLTARRCSQVENADSPRNWPSFCQVRTKMSCVTSSASWVPIIRRVRL